MTWRIFNTEDLVPTLPFAVLEIGENQISGNVLARLFGNGYEHVGYPIAVTSWKDNVTDNHGVPNILTALGVGTD